MKASPKGPACAGSREGTEGEEEREGKKNSDSAAAAGDSGSGGGKAGRLIRTRGARRRGGARRSRRPGSLRPLAELGGLRGVSLVELGGLVELDGLRGVAVRAAGLRLTDWAWAVLDPRLGEGRRPARGERVLHPLSPWRDRWPRGRRRWRAGGRSGEVARARKGERFSWRGNGFSLRVEPRGGVRGRPTIAEAAGDTAPQSAPVGAR